MALPYHIPKALEPINSKLPSQTCPCPHSSAWAVGHSTTRDTMVKPWDPKGTPTTGALSALPYHIPHCLSS